MSAPKGAPGVKLPALTGVARPAWPRLVRSLLLSRSFAVKSETGATRPCRTTYFWILVPDGASRTIPNLLAAAGSWPWIPAIGLNLAFMIDGLGFLFAFLITAIGLLIILYARYYLSQSDPTVTFGLGPAAVVDRVTVRWPGRGGLSRTWENLPAGKRKCPTTLTCSKGDTDGYDGWADGSAETVRCHKAEGDLPALLTAGGRHPCPLSCLEPRSRPLHHPASRCALRRTSSSH